MNRLKVWSKKMFEKWLDEHEDRMAYELIKPHIRYKPAWEDEKETNE